MQKKLQTNVAMAFCNFDLNLICYGINSEERHWDVNKARDSRNLKYFYPTFFVIHNLTNIPLKNTLTVLKISNATGPVDLTLPQV